ncbi:peamaclein, partial [Triticum aestivum]|uniref:peamaclein n=1 Tax=Triticum aestivum TaxID=4565 RepID=UPI001D02E3D3
ASHRGAGRCRCRSPCSSSCSSRAGKCAVRCARSRAKRGACMKYCGLCCEECACVPTGRSGSRVECPCYRDMLTAGPRKRPKCP